MKVLVTGSSGLVGSALCAALHRDKHLVARLVRHFVRAGFTEWRWNPAQGELDPQAVEGHDAVVHLSGTSIAERWSPARKAELRASRIESTALLAKRIAAAKHKPKVLVCASASGIYGDRGDEVLHEGSELGSGFLPELARDWEAAAEPARLAGVRVVHARLGLVLSSQGGALQRMLLPFRLGLGGPLGSGKQWVSWITLPDAVSAIGFALTNESIRGPLNTVAPTPVRQREFARALGRAVHRPALLPAPAFALKLLLGEMAGPLLLEGQRLEPRVLQQNAFAWQAPELDQGLALALEPASY